MEDLSQYKKILENFNKYFTFYRDFQDSDTNSRIFHATSQYLSFCQRSIALIHDTTRIGNSSSSIWEQLERLLDSIRNLQDLKITFSDDHIVDLSLFHSLKNLQITGPCVSKLKGLRALSSRLDSLIVQKSDTSLHTLLSKCCVDESGPMSWPCLYALHVTHSSLTILDSCLKLVPCLQQLDLSFNKLTDFEDKQLFLEQLTHLNLSFNRLKEVKIYGAARWRLQILLLAYNEISSLEGLVSLENLLVLDLSYNLLTSHEALQPLRHLHNLQELNLSGNPLCFDKQHRFLSVCQISPSAIKPEFLLDEKTLTKKELKDVMYTPVAVSMPPPVGYPSFSLNASGDHRYDVSMSSPMENARRRNEVVSRSLPFKSRKKSRPVLEISSSQQPTIITGEENIDSVNKILRDAEESELPSNRPEDLDNEQENASCSYHSSSSADSLLEFEDDSDSRSIVSAISQDSDDSGEDSKSVGSASALSCRDEESRRTTATSEEYFSTIDDYNVYDTSNKVICTTGNVGSATSDETERRGSTSDSRTSETDTLIGNEDELKIEEEVTPPLHVKRKLLNVGQETTQAGRDLLRATDVTILGPEEVYLAATHNHLIERDIETGKVWEQLELTTITDVSLRFLNETPELEVKFTYLRKDRRSRRYVICDIGANEAVNLLFRELESISIRNRHVRSRNYVCLKCSRNFVTGQNSALDSYALQSESVSPGATFGLGQSSLVNKQKTSGVVCSCGSEMVVETEGRIQKTSLYTVGEDDCAEATENNVSMARQSSQSFKGQRSASVDVGDGGGRNPQSKLRRVATVDASLSWINSLQSVQNMSSSFCPNQHAGKSDMESHLSGSLPTDISSVMMRPGNSVSGNLETATSVPAVNRSHQQATPFKTFSHLLTTHDLYKLVDVTPSVLGAGKGMPVRGTTEDSGVFTPNQPTEMSLNSPALTKDIQLSGRRQVLRDGRKMVVTSTPRRRAAAFPAPNPAFSADSNVVVTINADVGRGPKRRRALDFAGENLFQRTQDIAAAPVEYYEWDEPEISLAEENCCFDIDPKLKRFIEDELLEAEEELCAVVQTRLGHCAGKALGGSTPQSKRRKKKGSQAASKALQKIKSDEEEDKEEDVLLLLTTENVQILRIEKKKKISSLGPDTLDCFATHHLNHVMGVEFGMSHTMLFFAVSTGLDNSELTTDGLSPSSPSMNKSSSAKKKKKITVEQIDVIYTVFLRDQVKCERFYRRWMDLYKMRRESNSRAASTVSSNNSMPRSDRKSIRLMECGPGNALLVPKEDDRCVSALSDALEKNFSEHVLMNLDLNLPEAEIVEENVIDNKRSDLLTESLFVYIPCWILDVESGKDRAVGIVVSCGGSLALVVEDSTTVMKEFASALVHVYNTKQAKCKGNSPSSLLQASFSSSSSFSQTSTPSFPISLPQLALPSLAKALYTIEDLAKCSDLQDVVRFREHPLTLEFNFCPVESTKQQRTWHLTFTWPFTVTNLLDLVSTNWKVAQGENLEILWK